MLYTIHPTATMTLFLSKNDVEEMTFQTASFQQKLEISTEKSNLHASSQVATRRLLATILVLLLGKHTNNLLTVTIVESVPDMSNTKRFAKRAGRNVDQVPKGMTPCLLEAISRGVNSTVWPGTIVDLIGYTETSCFGGAGKNDVTLSFEKGGERNLTVYGSTLANALGITLEEAHATLEENDPVATNGQQHLLMGSRSFGKDRIQGLIVNKTREGTK